MPDYTQVHACTCTHTLHLMLRASCLKLEINEFGCYEFGCHGPVAEHWQLKPEMSWVRLPAAAGLFHFPLFSPHNIQIHLRYTCCTCTHTHTHTHTRVIPTLSIPTSSIPIWSTSHFVNSHFVNSHLVNVDKARIDKVGINEVGN